MTADFHLHTSFSWDSETPPRAVVEAALKAGLSILCFTDHMDTDYPYDGDSFEFNTDEYFTQLSVLQAEYRDRIEIRIGVELGLQPHLGDIHRSYLKCRPFDFVIGSTHIVDRLDPYYPDFWELYDKKQGIARYLETTMENIRHYDDFDVYGHLDYIVRYIPNGEKSFSYQNYADQVDEILKHLLAHGKGLEINTGSFRSGLTVTNPCPDVLKRYLELGGEIITLGSDAHTPEYTGSRLDYAKEVLRDCGFRYFTVFRERRPEFLPL